MYWGSKNQTCWCRVGLTNVEERGEITFNLLATVVAPVPYKKSKFKLLKCLRSYFKT